MHLLFSNHVHIQPRQCSNSLAKNSPAPASLLVPFALHGHKVEPEESTPSRRMAGDLCDSVPRRVYPASIWFEPMCLGLCKNKWTTCWRPKVDLDIKLNESGAKVFDFFRFPWWECKGSACTTVLLGSIDILIEIHALQYFCYGFEVVDTSGGEAQG
jgi:hypothetical protein